MKSLKCFISIVLLLSFTGCSTQTNQTSGGETDEYSKNLKTINIVGDGPNTVELFKMEEKEIAERFGLRLNYIYPDRITEDMEDFISSFHDDIDILVLYPGKVPIYVEKEMIIPLTNYMTSQTTEDIIPLYRQMYMKYDEQDYGMIYDGDSHLLFYRKDIFEKYADEYKQAFGKDLKPPTTWEEYDQLANFLTRDINNDGTIDLYGTAILSAEGMGYIWYTERFLSMGGSYFDDNMKPLIHSPLGIKALEDLVELANSKAVPPHSMYDWTDLNNAFLQGKLAMVVQWSDTARFSYDTDSWNSQVAGKVDWSLVPGELPDAPRGGAWIGRVLTISNTSKNQEDAWKIIQYITSKEVSKRAVNSYATGNDPYRESHFDVDSKGPFSSIEENEHFLSTVRESLKNTNTDLLIPGSWEYMQILDRYVGLAVIGKMSPKAALNEAAAEWEAVTERYGREKQKQYFQSWKERSEQVKIKSN